MSDACVGNAVHHFLRKRSRRTTSPVDSPLPDTGGDSSALVATVCGPGSFLGDGLGDFAAGVCFADEGFLTEPGFAVSRGASAGASARASLVASTSTVNCSPNCTDGSIN